MKRGLMKRMAPAARLGRGFTLLEMLIGMALLSVLMLALGGALFSAAQTEERLDARLQAAEDYRLMTGFLQETLAQASLQKVKSGDDFRIFFNGQSDSLEWVGNLPARYGLGGRHFLRLGLERDAAGAGRLVLRYIPWRDIPGALSWQAAAAQTLAAPVTGLSLRYQHPISGQWQPLWQDTSQRRERLPSAVALALESPEPAWPLLAVAMRVPMVSDQDARSEGFGL